MLQIGGQLNNVRRTEARRVVAEIQAQAVAQLDAQGQWIVGAFVVVQVAERQPGRGALLERCRYREVLEHQQAVEQRGPLLARPSLNVVERHMLVLAHGQVHLLQLAQPLADGAIGLHGADQRQRVDEQPKLFFDPRQWRRATGDRGPEHHAILAGIALQQQAPGSLQHSVEGDLLLAGELGQALGRGAVEGNAVVLATFGSHRRAQGFSQQRWGLQGSQRSLPEALARHGGLLLQPAQVVAVLPAFLPRQCRDRRASGVVLDHFGQQLRVAPAVHQNMVAGVDQVPVLVARLHEFQAKQRRAAQLKTLSTFGVGQGIGVSRVQHLKRQGDLTDNRLMRAVEALPMEAAAQDVVPG